MESFVTLGIMAIVVQFVVERFKPFLPEKHRPIIVPLGGLIVGVVLAVAAQIGLLTTVGISVTPAWIDYILTGVAFSGGSVAFNELIKLIQELRPSNK